MKLRLILFALATILINVGYAQSTITITDADLGTGEYTWTSDQVYLLDGYVYLEAGGILNIEAGTIIKAKNTTTTGDLTSALIIARGAKIMAEGRADAPIIFTGELDDLSTTEDLLATDSRTWGGIIILGNSIVGEDGGTDVIEGLPSDESRIQYGGDDPMDNSGVLKYVSIRHGGSVLGSDNEINGLTLGGVGAGTTIDYIEVFANKDDGIEFFGGTVNVTHAVVAFVGDDSFDFDESYDGTLQFIFSIQQDLIDDLGDHAIEYDGSERADQGPKTIGKIYNGTFIGSGIAGNNSSSNGLRLRKDGAAQFWNCIWTESSDYMFRVEDSSIDRMAAGESAFVNNIVFDYRSYVKNNETAVFDALNNGNTKEVAPGLAGISRIPNGSLDPRLNPDSPAVSGATFNVEDEVEEVAFIGAFGESNNWAKGWTALDAYGYFGDLVMTNTANYISNKEGLSLSTFPNPIQAGVANIRFELPATSPVMMYLSNMAGQTVATTNYGKVNAGENSTLLHVHNLPNGLYILAIQTTFGTITQKISVAK